MDIKEVSTSLKPNLRLDFSAVKNSAKRASRRYEASADQNESLVFAENNLFEVAEDCKRGSLEINNGRAITEEN